jgi:hypothetical protein
MTTRTKFLTFSILLMLTTFISFGQKPNLLNSTVNEIAKYNIYETTNTVGYANVISKQYQRFELLISLATEEQLTNLATHNKNAIVRLYALQALKRKRINISSVMRQQFERDNTMVETLEGCLGDKKSVKILAIQELKVPVSFSN